MKGGIYLPGQQESLFMLLFTPGDRLLSVRPCIYLDFLLSIRLCFFHANLYKCAFRQ